MSDHVSDHVVGTYVFQRGYLVQQAQPAAPAPPPPPQPPCPLCGTELNRQAGTLQQRPFLSCAKCEHCEEL